jgi:hypothetical protein
MGDAGLAGEVAQGELGVPACHESKALAQANFSQVSVMIRLLGRAWARHLAIV